MRIEKEGVLSKKRKRSDIPTFISLSVRVRFTSYIMYWGLRAILYNHRTTLDTMDLFFELYYILGFNWSSYLNIKKCQFDVC